MAPNDPLWTFGTTRRQWPLSRDAIEKVGVELFARFSRVLLPLTYASERFVGPSEMADFSAYGVAAACGDFFNSIKVELPCAHKLRSGILRPLQPLVDVIAATALLREAGHERTGG